MKETGAAGVQSTGEGVPGEANGTFWWHMDCKYTKDHLTHFHLGELSPEGAAAVQRHLDGCSVCRARSRDLKLTLDLLGSALADTQAPSALSAARRQEVRSGPAGRAVLRGGRWLARPHPSLAAAASLAIVCGLSWIVVSSVRSARTGTDAVPASGPEQAQAKGETRRQSAFRYDAAGDLPSDDEAVKAQRGGTEKAADASAGMMALGLDAVMAKDDGVSAPLRPRPEPVQTSPAGPKRDGRKLGGGQPVDGSPVFARDALPEPGAPEQTPSAAPPTVTRSISAPVPDVRAAGERQKGSEGDIVSSRGRDAKEAMAAPAPALLAETPAPQPEEEEAPTVVEDGARLLRKSSDETHPPGVEEAKRELQSEPAGGKAGDIGRIAGIKASLSRGERPPVEWVHAKELVAHFSGVQDRRYSAVRPAAAEGFDNMSASPGTDAAVRTQEAGADEVVTAAGWLAAVLAGEGGEARRELVASAERLRATEGNQQADTRVVELLEWIEMTLKVFPQP